MPRPSLEEIGSRQSLMGSRFVGFMRWSSGALAGLTAAAGAGVGLAALEARFPNCAALQRFSASPSRVARNNHSAYL